MSKPLLLKIMAEKDGSVDKVFDGTKKDAEGLSTTFDQAAADSEKLSAIIKSLSQTTEKLDAALSKTTQGVLSLSKSLEVGSKGMEEVSKGAKEGADDLKKLRKEAEEAGKSLLNVEAKTPTTSQPAIPVPIVPPVPPEVAKEAEKVADALEDIGDKSRHAGKSLDEALGDQLVSKLIAIEAVSNGLQSAFTAASSAIGGLAKASIETAAEFEVLEAKLATVLGSAEKAREAMTFSQDYAAKTPFDVNDVVNATVQLEVYGQRSQDILPKVAALAAGMGKSLQETSLVVGKALSGSLEGFEGLRNTYGITTRELVKFGAAANGAGGILVTTAADARKAEEALKKIIELRFGDAIERQSKTLTGQLSNAQDEVTNFTSEVGKGAAEVAKLGASFVGGGFSMLRQIPGPLKEVAGASLAVAAGVTAIGATAAGSAVGLLALNTQLTAAALTVPALAPLATASAGALSAIGVGATAAGAALRFMLGPFGLAITAMGGAYMATERYIDQQKDLQADIKEEIRLSQERIKTYRDLIGKVNELADADARRRGEEVPSAAGLQTAEGRLEKLKKVLDEASASKFFDKFKEVGLDAESVRKKVSEIGDDAKNQAEEIKRVSALLEESRRADADYNIRSASLGGPMLTSNRTQQLENELQLAERTKLDLEEEAKALKLVDERYSEIQGSLDGVSKAAQRSRDFLKYSDQSGEVRDLNESLGVLQENISAASREMQKLNMPTDRNGLLAELKAGIDNAEIRGQVTQYLDLLDEQDKREQDLRKRSIAGEKDKISAIQSTLDDAKAARDVSAQEELSSLKAQYEIAVRIGKDGEAEITRIKRREAAIRRDEDKKAERISRESAQAALDAAATLPVGVKTAQKGTQQAVDAYDEAITRVNNWVAANGNLIKQFPELGKRGQSAIRSLEMGRAQAEVARTAKGFSDLQKTLRDLEADAESTADKLEAVARAKDLTASAKATGKITEEQAEDVTGDLERKTRDLNKAKAQEDIRYRQEQLALDEAAAQQELLIAETLEDGTLKSNDRLIVAREKLHQFRLEAIRLEAEAAIAAGEDKVRVEQTAADKIKQIERQRTVDLHAELKKRHQAEKDRLEDIIDANKTEDAFNVPGLDFGTGSDADDKRRARKAAEKELEAVNRAEKFRVLNPEVVAKAAEEERQKALKAADPSGILKQTQGQLHAQAEAPAAQTVNATNTVNVYVEAKKTRTFEDPRAAVEEVRKAIMTNQYYDPGAGVT